MTHDDAVVPTGSSNGEPTRPSSDRDGVQGGALLHAGRGSTRTCPLGRGRARQARGGPVGGWRLQEGQELSAGLHVTIHVQKSE